VFINSTGTYRHGQRDFPQPYSLDEQIPDKKTSSPKHRQDQQLLGNSKSSIPMMQLYPGRQSLRNVNKKKKDQAYSKEYILFTDGTTLQNAALILKRGESDWAMLMAAHRLFQNLSFKRVTLEQFTVRQ
jgi:hypothetical protein